MFSDNYVNSIHLQPKTKTLPDAIKPNYRAGSGASQQRLGDLNFDPIGELVVAHRRLELEIERMERWRDGIDVPLTGAGKPMSYRPEVHHKLYDNLTKISESLLRYGYGRVSETNVLETTTRTPLVINLSPSDVTVEEPD
jgi:hypothetical protein